MGMVLGLFERLHKFTLQFVAIEKPKLIPQEPGRPKGL
jgi:hypothetical protein